MTKHSRKPIVRMTIADRIIYVQPATTKLGMTARYVQATGGAR